MSSRHVTPSGVIVFVSSGDGVSRGGLAATVFPDFLFFPFFLSFALPDRPLGLIPDGPSALSSSDFLESCTAPETVTTGAQPAAR